MADEAPDRASGLVAGLAEDVVERLRGLTDLVGRAGRGRLGAVTAPAADALPADRAVPMVTVLDGHPHTLAFLAGVHRVPATHLGVSRFGQSGDLDSVYRYHGLDAASIVGSALDLVD